MYSFLVFRVEEERGRVVDCRLDNTNFCVAGVEWTNPDGSTGSFTPKHDHGHDDVHGEASILPWHRYAISIFEDALVNECGWQMGMPCKSSPPCFGVRSDKM